MSAIEYLMFVCRLRSRLSNAKRAENNEKSCLVAQRFGRRTFDEAVLGSIPGRDVVKAGQLGLPSLRGGQIEYQPVSNTSLHWLGLRRGVLAYTGCNASKIV